MGKMHNCLQNLNVSYTLSYIIYRVIVIINTTLKKSKALSTILADMSATFNPIHIT